MASIQAFLCVSPHPPPHPTPVCVCVCVCALFLLLFFFFLFSKFTNWGVWWRLPSSSLTLGLPHFPAALTSVIYSMEAPWCQGHLPLWQHYFKLCRGTCVETQRWRLVPQLEVPAFSGRETVSLGKRSCLNWALFCLSVQRPQWSVAKPVRVKPFKGRKWMWMKSLKTK